MLHSSAHVLIAEGDAALRQLYRELFEEEGYRVTLRDRLPQVAEIRASAPDLVILDFLRSRGCVLALIRALRAEPTTASMPLIVCTGAVLAVRAAEAELASLDVGMVLKPFDLDDLLAELRCRLPGGRRRSLAP